MKPTGTARRTTARRIVGAFAIVLLLFGGALVAVLVALQQIGDAEDEVAKLDHAKHAGHMAAGLAREQYIHQAHTLLEWNDSHLEHYGEISKQAAAATKHLEQMVDTDENRARARAITQLVAESDARFRAEVVPAVGGADRSRAHELHRGTEELVERVVALNEELNRDLETHSAQAQERAKTIRRRALLTVAIFFALAIAASIAVGAYLMGSISRPVALVRAGAQRIGMGDLAARIPLHGDDEISALGESFNRMAEDLAQHQAELIERSRLASIGQVAAGVAHEINNPLGVMLGYIKILRQDAALANREELTIIEDELRQCQVIVAALLDLARPVRLHRAETDLDDLVREVVSRLDETGKLEGVRVEIAGNGVSHVDGDEGKLKQIVLNLVGNAVDAAREKGASGTEVRVATGVEDCVGYVDVTDRGPGIPAAARDRLFEPFFSTKSKGHGLGLAIARTLARAHGGDVELEPGPDDVGTRARVWIPVEAPREVT